MREVALSVNSMDDLQARVDDCQATVARNPNIIAVDFVQECDLVTFVNQLNSVGTD